MLGLTAGCSKAESRATMKTESLRFCGAVAVARGDNESSNHQCPRLALLQLNPAVRRRDLQFSSPAAHRAGERLRAKRSLYGNRKVRVNPAIGGGRVHLEFRGSGQRHVHTAIGGHELQL